MASGVHESVNLGKNVSFIYDYKVTVAKLISNKYFQHGNIVGRPWSALFFRASPVIFNYFEEIFPVSV